MTNNTDNINDWPLLFFCGVDFKFFLNEFSLQNI
jgi:hypothetical protein